MPARPNAARRAADSQPAKDPYSAALGMLARRPYSVAELRRALEKKFPDESAIEEAIVRLRSVGYLDDRRFAEHYASSLARNKSFGSFRVRRELKSRLVNYKFVEPAIEQAYEETSERELLERSIDKKIRAMKLPPTPSKLHSLCQSLLRRGFAADAIMKSIRSRPELKPVAEDVDVGEIDHDQL